MLQTPLTLHLNVYYEFKHTNYYSSLTIYILHDYKEWFQQNKDTILTSLKQKIISMLTTPSESSSSSSMKLNTAEKNNDVEFALGDGFKMVYMRIPIRSSHILVQQSPSLSSRGATPFKHTDNDLLVWMIPPNVDFPIGFLS